MVRATCFTAIAVLIFAGNPSWAAQPSKSGGKKPAPKKPAETIPVPERAVVIGKVDVDRRASALSSAKTIDRLVAANYEKHNIKPNELCSDEVFVRRAYLDVTGTIPTLKQTKAFLAQRDADRRARLVDTLLNSPGYSSNFYNYWADILRLADTLRDNVPGRPFCEWVKESLETNKPYDKFVYEMLTAEGKIFENGASGYILKDSGMPLDALNNTVRVFLGTQIGCAQCHDHPFDRWTRKEFYQLAAFTFGTGTRRNAADKQMFGGKNVVNQLRADLKKVDPDFVGDGKYNRFLLANLQEVYDDGRSLKMPHDYQYSDAKPNDPVAPKTIFGDDVKVSKDMPPRKVFANWLTARENPRFAKNIANRMWKRLFGIGQIEPVDDIRDDSTPENPELLAHLEAEMIRVKFDVKEYLRILLNTQTYQRESSHNEVAGGENYHFPGPVLRRMTAEQAWDSFITLAVFDPKEYQAEPASVQSELLDIDLAKVTAEEVVRRDKELREATSGKVRDARNKDHSYKGLLLVRASELPQPSPAGHFLRQFGQSDRQSIEASSTDSSVPQILQMFNGAVTHMLLEPKSLMVNTVTAEKDVADRVDIIFLSILNRKPKPDQKTAALAEIKEHGNAGYGNVIWSLVNTREFLFIQ